jgi:hypothetical protein
VPQSAFPSLPRATFTVRPVEPGTKLPASTIPAECTFLYWGATATQTTGASLTKTSETDAVVEYGYSRSLAIDETVSDLKAILRACDSREIRDGLGGNPYTLHSLDLPGLPDWAVAYNFVIDHDYVWKSFIEGYYRGVDVVISGDGYPEDHVASDTAAMVRTFNAQVARLSRR